MASPQERATPLDELIVTSTDGEHLPVRSRDRQDPRRISCLWARPSGVRRRHEITGEMVLTLIPVTRTFS
ncbi:hypothetical protein J7E88_29430 [Streptomyces sp. ISL-10]|uniref:hypothetical protein n=1 Tax=Streptomyces sp. ISL-10 TaxID=2819172 RepID=UPI001BE53A28|nr:hypothetical protein [Streptomyces sp. ISL-10]MBT2369315.1 hypothetical protein [Streptomyces sp. ISL-10]